MLTTKRLCLRTAPYFVVMTIASMLFVDMSTNTRQRQSRDDKRKLNNSYLSQLPQIKDAINSELEQSTTKTKESHVQTRQYTSSQREIQTNLVVFYNRVPKCGSSGLIDVISKMATNNNFTFVRSNLYMKFWLNEIEEERLIHNIERMEKPLVFERHVHFVDFDKYSADLSLVYINVIRDPIQRLASWYYYRRYQTGHMRKMPLSERIRSYDECVLGNHSECVSPQGDSAEEGYFKIIPFFCGQEDFCSYPNDRALHRAVSNVKHRYLAVGTTEYLQQFIQLLETKLPAYFSGASAAYHSMESILKERYHTRYKLPVSTEVVQIMKTKLKHEYQFYYFIRNRFRRQYEETYNTSLPL